MAQETVGDVVRALLDSYTAALECYAGWRQKQWLDNHYRTRGEADKQKTGFCAASSSLAISRLKIEEAYSTGVDMLGQEFVLGDAACYDVIQENLQRLQDCIGFLYAAANIDNHPLPLCEVTRVSEAARIACLTALQKQYQRLVVGRLVPRELPQPQPQPQRPADATNEETPHQTRIEEEEEAAQQSTSEVLTPRQHSTPSPPSPPLTPTGPFKSPLNDTQFGSSSCFSSRPTKSVFSVFCPEAMQYQVDLEKPTPPKGTKCNCGYDWGDSAIDGRVMVIKDGFHMTPRFLGKSHTEKGFGCVLCTSSGKTETFDSIEKLKAHINSCHTKWQLLHDRDLSGH